MAGTSVAYAFPEGTHRVSFREGTGDPHQAQVVRHSLATDS